MIFRIERIEIKNGKVFVTIYNEYEKFNMVPLEKIKIVRKNNKIYAKLNIK